MGIFSFLTDTVKTITTSIFPDKARIAEAIAKSDVKSSAAEIQDLISGASKWRKWIAFSSMFYFLAYCSVYYIVPQIYGLLDVDQFYQEVVTEGHLHSMYISGGLVTVSIIGREIVKLVRAWRV